MQRTVAQLPLTATPKRKSAIELPCGCALCNAVMRQSEHTERAAVVSTARTHSGAPLRLYAYGVQACLSARDARLLVLSRLRMALYSTAVGVNHS
jgi:hypothetical protein